MIRPTVVLLLVAFVGLAQGRAWEAVADGIPQLEEVEKALKMVSTAKLGPKQQAAAQRAVADVNKVLADLSHDHSLTKEQKATKVKGAIRELQGLQAQWQLASVEASLKQVVMDPNLTPQQLLKVKTVVSEVDAVLDEVESGKLDGDARGKKVASAIQQLQSLEQELAKAAVSSKEADLERKIAAKKLQLKEAQTELKLADLKKELLEKQIQMKKLVAAKKDAEEDEKQRQEGEAEQAQVANLLAAAKAMAAAKKDDKRAPAAAKSDQAAKPAAAAAVTNLVATKHEGTPSKPQAPDMSDIVANLQGKLQKDTQNLAKFDADFSSRMTDLQKSVTESKKVSSMRGKGKSAAQSVQMLEASLKRQQRMHAKARALRVSEINDLKTGIENVKKGDIAALSVLLGKMEKESKSMQAVGQKFLH